jgi:hypothetical protein
MYSAMYCTTFDIIRLESQVYCSSFLDTKLKLYVDYTRGKFVQCALGYNEFDFFLENSDPLMGAKLKCKTHLLKIFFDCLSRCFAYLASTPF